MSEWIAQIFAITGISAIERTLPVGPIELFYILLMYFIVQISVISGTFSKISGVTTIRDFSLCSK